MIVIAVLLPWLALLINWASISGGVLPRTPAYGAGMDPRGDLGCFGGQRRPTATPVPVKCSGCFMAAEIRRNRPGDRGPLKQPRDRTDGED